MIINNDVMMLQQIENDQNTDDEVEFEEDDEPSRSLINSVMKSEKSSLLVARQSKNQNVISHNVDDELFKS